MVSKNCRLLVVAWFGGFLFFSSCFFSAVLDFFMKKRGLTTVLSGEGTVVRRARLATCLNYYCPDYKTMWLQLIVVTRMTITTRIRLETIKMLMLFLLLLLLLL